MSITLAKSAGQFASGRVLPDVSKPAMPDLASLSKEQLVAMIAELAKGNQRASGKLTFKVSEKGAFCIYGNGRFPHTFYLSQWDRLISQIDDAKAFVEAHRHEFAVREK